MKKNKEILKNLIEVVQNRKEADLALTNASVVDVYNHAILKNKTVLIKDGFIAGFASDDKFKAKKVVDVKGDYVMPGFINGHVHIESSHLSPEMFASAVVPHGTTTVIADPHEICNVCGLDGLDYFYKASENLPLTVFFVIPSCVPATPFENAGAVITAKDIETRIHLDRVLGLGELMNYIGVINSDSEILDKIMVAEKHNKIIDGHSPTLMGSALDAYIAAGPFTDHECATPEEVRERTSRGMYVLLRQGSACHDVERLAPGVDEYNSRLCIFCTDDRQPRSIVDEGDINNNIRLAVKSGIDPITAIQIATINAATAHNLRDRGAVAPGKRADLVVAKDIKNPKPSLVITEGNIVAEKGKYLLPINVMKSDKVSGKVNIGDFNKDKLKLKINSNKAHAIGILEGSVVTENRIVDISKDKDGYVISDTKKDVLKIAVVERHHGTGNVGVGLIQGYGLKKGAVALSIAHDSHNFIVVGVNDDEMAYAVKELEKIGGGIVLVQDQKTIFAAEHEIAGLVTAKKNVTEIADELDKIHHIAVDQLGVSKKVDPIMTLCFMALPVIPEIKITDTGVFDVNAFKTISLEA